MRTPTLPYHYYNKRIGYCRWCGKEADSQKAYWHKQCLFLYKIVSSPSFARKIVFSRDHGICKQCGLRCTPGGWQVDHIKPLKDSLGRLRFFMLDNMQTLCTACHVSKTAAERRETDMLK